MIDYTACGGNHAATFFRTENMANIKNSFAGWPILLASMVMLISSTSLKLFQTDAWYQARVEWSQNFAVPTLEYVKWGDGNGRFGDVV